MIKKEFLRSEFFRDYFGPGVLSGLVTMAVFVVLAYVCDQFVQAREGIADGAFWPVIKWGAGFSFSVLIAFLLIPFTGLDYGHGLTVAFVFVAPVVVTLFVYFCKLVVYLYKQLPVIQES